ncbi:integrator complex subunit 15 [Oratosquilla oratoria]|uniref:integrator complex subunit 15 n=1 Tax=Oratosquilla oratoria TaxID=337810 RepID=UPI003F7579BC
MSVDLGVLLRLEFPTCVREGLRKLEEVIKLPTSSQQHGTQQYIMDEFIFCFKDHKIGKPKPLGPVEELAIVQQMAHHIGESVDAASQNTLFITLFHPAANDVRTPHKLRILGSLVSLAVVTHNASVLEATAVWLQQVCCLSSCSGEVCQGLVRDYFLPNPSSPSMPSPLTPLPSIAPLFTANLITAASQLYANLGTGNICVVPPLPLVRTFASWLCTHPHLALVPLTQPLPGISLPMTAVPPILTIVKLCVESPFFLRYHAQTQSPLPSSRRPTLTKITQDMVKVEGKEGWKEDVQEAEELYSKLHLSMLKTLQSVTTVRCRMTQRQVLCPKQVLSMIEAVSERVKQCKSSDQDCLQLSLDRLAQVILVALRTDCLSGSLGDIWKAFRTLPSNRLIRTLLDTHGIR